ncbi:MAG: RadC family protein [Candidatus Saccharibacteria bacterium]
MAKNLRIHELAITDRPREKMQRKGVAALSDYELLEVLIGTGNAGADVTFMARKVQKLFHQGTQHLNYDTLTAIRGINTATASKILASLEITRRYLIRDVEPIRTQQDILARLDDIRGKQQEHVLCLSLDGGQRLIALRTITIGTLDSVIAHPREVFADAITDRAAEIIIAHNHPSGDCTPSQRDIQLSQQLAAAGQLLGIALRDHIIVTKTSHFSFRQHHYLYT